MMRIIKIVQAGLLVLCLWPIATAAGFGMGGPGVAVGVGVSMGGSSTMSSLAYGHGSPAATNPAVAAMEARQRDTQIAVEIDTMRKAGRSVTAAQADRRKADGALESNHAEEAMVDFDHAERDLGIVPKTTAIGAYSESPLGSVAPGGTELSGAVVH
jgi:Spy/CpxP family protein refolding chaperone